MKPNSIEFMVSGRYALFSDPINRVGGEKMTYQVPTYEALKGIAGGIYWKPTLTWFIDEVRVMKPIRSEAKGIRPVGYGGGNTLSIYSYLSDVCYQVKAHFEWNMFREDLQYDRNENKHHNIAKRSVKIGGRRDIFLGTSECGAYVEECSFGQGVGAYDDYGQLPLGVMFHGFTYPDENADGKMIARFWQPTMEDGVIKFIRPEECGIQRELFVANAKEFKQGVNFESVEEFDIAAEFGGVTNELDF